MYVVSIFHLITDNIFKRVCYQHSYGQTCKAYKCMWFWSIFI